MPTFTAIGKDGFGRSVTLKIESKTQGEAYRSLKVQNPKLIVGQPVEVKEPVK